MTASQANEQPYSRRRFPSHIVVETPFTFIATENHDLTLSYFRAHHRNLGPLHGQVTTD
jgi:hypothetical protein